MKLFFVWFSVAMRIAHVGALPHMRWRAVRSALRSIGVLLINVALPAIAIHRLPLSSAMRGLVIGDSQLWPGCPAMPTQEGFFGSKSL